MSDYIDAEARVYRTQSSMADAMALQCRVEIQVTIMAFERNRLQIPDDLVEEPLNLEKLQKEPGMIGYVVQEGDDLWSIAKHFHTTRQELMETNDLTQETLQKGQTAGDETYLSDVLRWFSSIFRLQMLALFSIII